MDDDADSSIATSSTSSRRQWFQNVLATTTATATAGTFLCASSSSPAVANAADIPTNIKSICDPTVSIWKKDSRVVYLLGTAHISEASAELAGTLVRDIHPKGVFVELDPKRVRGSGILAQKVNIDGEASTEEEVPKSRIIVPQITVASSSSAGSDSPFSSSLTTASPSLSSESPLSASATATATTVPTKKPGPLMRVASAAVGNGIRGMYKKLDSTGFKAGEEFTVAIREAQTMGADIVLGDRDVEITLNRLAEGLSKTDLNMLLNPDSEMEQNLKALFPSDNPTSEKLTSGNGDLNDEEFRKEFTSFVEVIKTKENVRKIMAQLQKSAPALYEALVSERDAYMAAGLNGLDELETIVAVMGIAHVDGVECNLKMNGWNNVTPTDCRS